MKELRRKLYLPVLTGLMIIALSTTVCCLNDVRLDMQSQLDGQSVRVQQLEDQLIAKSLENVDLTLDNMACTEILNNVLDNRTKGECYDEARRYEDEREQ
jgi:hypothetical protein